MHTRYATRCSGIVILILYHSFLCAQTWNLQNSGSSAWLEKVEFVNSELGWCIGSGGTILHTVNGGDTWQAQTSSATSYLRDIHMLNANEGWIVGQDGVVLHTTNGGANWSLLPFPSQMELRALWVISPDTLWVTGTPDIMYRSVNGGMNWEEMLTEVGDELNSIWFLEDGMHGWAAGLLSSTGQGQTGQVRLTTDGGETWQLSTASQNFGWFQAIQFTDQDYGWSCTADGKILRSLDGGVNWQVDQNGPSSGFFDIVFIDESEGWCAGGGGVIWHTFNAGAIWTPETSGTSQYLYDIEVLPGGEAWACGAGGTIIHRGAGPTSIEEVPTLDVIVHPSPADDVITIRSNHGTSGHARMFDPLGRIVKEWSGRMDRDVDTSDLKNGQYLLELSSDGRSNRFPVIVQR